MKEGEYINNPFRLGKMNAEALKRNNILIRKSELILYIFSIISILFFILLFGSQSFAQQTQQVLPKVYVFNGNGNWSNASNWIGSIKPPGLLPKGDSILVQTAKGDSCILDVAQYLAEGAVLKVVDGSNFVLKNGMVQFVPSANFFTDKRDGKKYPIKRYGTQTWMTINLNYNQAGSKVYDNDPNNAPIYGRLYTWAQAKSAVPVGWHLPSLAEWNTLISFLGGAGPMKDTMYWQSPNTAATNSSGFSARPGGLFAQPDFEDIGNFGLWWTSNEHSEVGSFNWAYYFQAGYNTQGFYSDYLYKDTYALSVRCVKD